MKTIINKYLYIKCCLHASQQTHFALKLGRRLLALQQRRLNLLVLLLGAAKRYGKVQLAKVPADICLSGSFCPIALPRPPSSSVTGMLREMVCNRIKT
jgi:hypothetical protein